MKLLESKVRDDLIRQRKQQHQKKDTEGEEEKRGDVDDDIDQGDLTVAMMEALKQDNSFRNNLFRQLEQEVPEFTQAFLKERDYIMSESIRQQVVVASATASTSTDTS